MNSYASLYAITKINTDETQYFKYKNYLFARAVIEQYRTNCSDNTEIQMHYYNYKPDSDSQYPFVKISNPEFFKYERTFQEFINSLIEFLKTVI